MDDILSEISSTDGSLSITDAIKNHLAIKRESLLNLESALRNRLSNVSAEIQHLEETGDDSVKSYKTMKRKIKQVNRISETLENLLRDIDSEGSRASIKPRPVTQVNIHQKY